MVREYKCMKASICFERCSPSTFIHVKSDVFCTLLFIFVASKCTTFFLHTYVYVHA